MPSGPEPTFTVYVLDDVPSGAAIGHWPSRWVSWPDFGLPTDPDDLREALTEALANAELGRVEVACWGGRGRTGTAMACLAVLDGMAPQEAVAWVRRRYDPDAVETQEQENFVARFAGR